MGTAWQWEPCLYVCEKLSRAPEELGALQSRRGRGKGAVGGGSGLFSLINSFIET